MFQLAPPPTGKTEVPQVLSHPTAARTTACGAPAEGGQSRSWGGRRGGGTDRGDIAEPCSRGGG